MAQGSVLKYPYTFELTGTTPNPYTSDRGVNLGTSSVLVLPTDIASAANAQTIITAAGGIVPVAGSVCGDRGTFTPRKVRLIRSNKSSISVAIPTLTGVVARAQALANAVTALNTAFPVVCVQLIGEHYTNIITELRTATTAPTAGTPPRSPVAAGKSFSKYRGAMSYTRDVAGTVQVGFAINTDAVTGGVASAPTIAATEIATCLGTVTQIQKCSGRSQLKPRHYIATFLTTESGTGGTAVQGSTTLKIPEAAGTAASILACGQALANSASIICLGYKGEDEPRLQKLFTPGG